MMGVREIQGKDGEFYRESGFLLLEQPKLDYPRIWYRSEMNLALGKRGAAGRYLRVKLIYPTNLKLSATRLARMTVMTREQHLPANAIKVLVGPAVKDALPAWLQLTWPAHTCEQVSLVVDFRDLNPLTLEGAQDETRKLLATIHSTLSQKGSVSGRRQQ